MLQNLFLKFGSLFFNNHNNKRSSSPTKFILEEETPSKKVKLDLQSKEHPIMDERNEPKDLYSYLTRKVTIRNKTNEEKPKNNGYDFSNTDKSYSFQTEDNYKFQGSQNIWKSTPKTTVYNRIFPSKNKYSSKINIQKELTTYKQIQLKEKSEYEALVKKYSGDIQNLNLLSKSSNSIKSTTNQPLSSEIINIDNDESEYSINRRLEKLEQSINIRNRGDLSHNFVKSAKFDEKNILSDERNLKNFHTKDLIDVGNFNNDNNFIRNRLKQSYRFNLDSLANSNDNCVSKPSSTNLSNNNCCPLDNFVYRNDLNYLERIERKITKTSNFLNDIFSKNKQKFINEKENEHQFNVLDDDVIDITNDEKLPSINKFEIDEDKRNLRFKEIEDFSDALTKSSFSNQQYLSDLCRPAVTRDVKEQILKGETEINFYKKNRQKDDDILINQINRILQISKRIAPPVDESLLYIEDEEEDFIELIEEEEKEEEFTALTPEQEQKVANVFRADMSEKVVVEAFRLQLTYKDLLTLANLNWLNDEIINFYMNLIVDRDSTHIYTFNTFFYPKISSEGGQKSVRRWTKNVDIFSYKIILVPIHLGVHWCLAVIDFDKKQIRYYDSMGGNNQQCLHSLQKYLQDEHKDKKGSDFNLNDWQKIIVKDIPQQMNGSDCGMFACKFAEYISRNAAINFDQNHMPYFRKRMVLEIIEKKLWL